MIIILCHTASLQPATQSFNHFPGRQAGISYFFHFLLPPPIICFCSLLRVCLEAFLAPIEVSQAGGGSSNKRNKGNKGSTGDQNKRTSRGGGGGGVIDMSLLRTKAETTMLGQIRTTKAVLTDAMEKWKVFADSKVDLVQKLEELKEKGVFLALSMVLLSLGMAS